MVTGATGGIGCPVVSRLAAAGHRVFAAGRDPEALRARAASHPEIHPVTLDVTDMASIDGAVAEVRTATAGHGLDVLVNVAGAMFLGPVEAVPDELVRRQFEVNVFGLLAVTRAFLPQMRQRRNGRVVNVSSVLGRFALPGSGLYSASKFAVEAISDAMRMELAPFGVHVVLVEPGVVETPLYESAAEALSGFAGSFEPYRATFREGFAFPERLLKSATPADDAAVVVVKAALATEPRERYRPGVRNRLNVRLLTALPTGVSDRIKARITGMASSRVTPAEEAVARVEGRGSPARTERSGSGR
jgi:NAD(P)-dependent dehydrogenase (short-subunit alcohol dehydrogenase family)